MDDLGADYSKWLKADLWTIERAILLLVNAESLPSNSHYSFGGCKTTNEQIIYDDFMYVWDIAKPSLITGTLKKTNKSYPSLDSLVYPSDFIQWAKLKGFSLPDELKTIDTETQAEAVDDVGTVSHEGTKPKPAGKNQKRMSILNEWYGVLCLKHQNDIEAINQEINGLTNEEIKTGLANITQANESYLWAGGADRWIMNNGETVWQFKRTQGGKSKKS
jgi:hypothetical protein